MIPAGGSDPIGSHQLSSAELLGLRPLREPSSARPQLPPHKRKFLMEKFSLMPTSRLVLYFLHRPGLSCLQRSSARLR